MPHAPVATENAVASAAIEKLRDVAGTLKALGDKESVQAKRIHELTKELAEALDECDALKREKAELEESGTRELQSCHELIADHRRGLVDSEELYAHTVDATKYA